MSTLGFVNVSVWDVDQVCSWIKGLEKSAAQYADVFQEAGVNGKQLLSLDYSRLENLNIWKIGHQELILHSVQLLDAVNRELECDTLSVIALRLDCHAKNLSNLLKSPPSAVSRKPEPSGRLPLLERMCRVSDIVETVKCMIPWLDRVPFDDCEFFNDLRNRILDYTFELLAYSKDDNQDKMQDVCCSLSSVCEEIITNSKDPLVIQTASLELVTLRRNSDEPLGMSIVSLCDNVHTIGQIKAGSTADVSKKIDIGDEIVQVNYQTVIGWELKNLLTKFSDTKKDVTLTLKKKPRHLTLSGYQKKKTPKKQLPSAGAFQTQFNRKMANARAHSRRRIKHIMAASSSIPDADDNISDSEVFNSGTEFKEANNNEEKARRATVSGGSPVLPRRVVGSTENISSLRPKSYFPVSTNIPILPIDLQPKILKTKKLPSVEQSDSNSAAASVSGPQSPGASASSPTSRKGSSGSASEVAGGDGAEKTPRLLRLTKLDSNMRAELTEKKRNESISSLDSILSTSSCSSQGSSMSSLKQLKPHFRSERDLTSPSPSGLLRRNFMRRTGLNRRISCKDLGGGDCQGWLWKKKEGTGLVSGRWTKCWFVLKNKDLYYYNDPEDLKALGVIRLPGFTISPSQESRSKKYAFKAYKSDVIFFFAAERQDDMAKWMNKIGLASLANLDTSHFPTTAGFRKPGKESDYHLPDFSESDEEENKSVKDSSPASSIAGSREDLIGLYRHIRAANLDLAGTDVKARRSTLLLGASLDKKSPEKNEAICRLLSLKRTLKDKEQLLVILDELLQKSPITAVDLIHFKVTRPSAIEEILTEREEGKQENEEEEKETDPKEGGSSTGSELDILESFV